MMSSEFDQTIHACKEAGLNENITREMIWNTAYQLGRSRWHWGPAWFVSFVGRWNTWKHRLFLRKSARPEVTSGVL